MPLRFIIVAEQAQQRLAFSDTVREWGCELVDCLAVEQVEEKHFQAAVDVWLVDTERDYDIIQKIETKLNAETPRVILVGFIPAPYINESQLYAKWQRQLKRKIAERLQRPDLVKKVEEKAATIKPWKYVLLLGASMGGPLAVKEFLDFLPTHLPVAVILAQHFNQNMINTLPRILTRHNDWRCDIVTQSQQLIAGRCLIVPIEQSVVCDSNGRVILQPHGWQGLYQPCISQLLANCSEAFGSNLVSIIFSGMGDDGSDKAGLAKQNGASIWVQSLDSTTCPSQPKSTIETGQVDYIADPKALAMAVIDLCKTRRLPNGNPHF